MCFVFLKKLKTQPSHPHDLAELVHRGVTYLTQLPYLGSWVNSAESANYEADIRSIPIVMEFIDMFLEDIPGLPLDQEIEYVINVALGIQPILITPYRMALVELKELKIHL